MHRCMCGSKPVIIQHENSYEVYCTNCTRPHAYGQTRHKAKKEWNRLCSAEQKNRAQHKAVTGN